MKKRILAIVLACLMLVSALPTSAFADEHTHADAECPGASAGSAGHFKENCDEEKVLFVDSVCGKDGYTIYRCKGCGVNFIDDTFRNPGNHDYNEEAVAEVPATCYKDGLKEHYTCNNECGSLFTKNEKGEYVEVTKESLKIPAGHKPAPSNTGDCTKGDQICSVCGEVFGKQNEHNWGAPSILEYPTVNKDGWAVEKCENTGCNVERKILIEKQCLHDADNLEWKAEQEPDCENPGWIGHYECPLCKEATGKTVYLLDNGNTIVEVNASVVLKPALNHAWGEWEVDSGATCTEAGEKHRTCSRCGETETEEIPATKHLMKLDRHVDPTCTTFGSDHYVCGVCGATDAVSIPKLEHQTLEEATNAIRENPTCSTPGKATWTCQNTWIKVTKQDAAGNVLEWVEVTCGEAFEEELPVVDHSYKELYVAPTCAKTGFRLQYCEFADCTKHALTDVTSTGEKIIDLIKLYNTTVADSKKVAEADSVHLSFYQPLNKVTCGHAIEEHTEDCGHNWKQTELNAPSCLVDGSQGFICQDCGAYWHKKLPAEGNHKWVEDTTRYDPPTCATTGQRVYVCSACGGEKTEEIPTVDQSAINHIYYWASDSKAEHVTTIHGLPKDLTDPIYVIQNAELVDCDTQPIYYVTECPNCERGLMIVDDTNPIGDHTINPELEGYVPQKDATCFDAGKKESGYCNCGFFVDGDIIPAIHVSNPSNIKHVKPVHYECGVAGQKEHWYCDCELDEEGNPIRKYYLVANPTKDDVLTENEHDALHVYYEHNFVVHCEGPLADCENFGFYQHKVCLNDGCVYGDDLGYYGVLTEVKRVKGHVMNEATCDAPSTCQRPGCDHVGDPALGHENEAGKTIYADCVDGKGVEDRNCIRCGYVEIEHRNYGELVREANCSEYKIVTMWCTACEYHEKVEYVADGYLPDNHIWGEQTGEASFVSKVYRTCILCGYDDSHSETGFQVFLNASNADNGGFKYVDSSLIKVGISIASIEQVGIHTLVYEMTYDANNFRYWGSSMDENLPEGFASGSIWNRIENGIGYIRLVLVADNHTEDGVPQDYEIPALDENGNPTHLVDVYLRAWLEDEVRAELWENPKIKTKLPFSSGFATNEVSAVNVAGEYVACAGDDIAVNVYPLLDTDNNFVYEPTDIYYAYMIADKAQKQNGEAFEYHAAADVNKDGIINMIDLYYIYRYETREIDYEAVRRAGISADELYKLGA